jgi:hypothetical protein
MRWTTLACVGVALAVLVYGTVLVGMAFDRNSHSVSDTVRPTIVTMGPVWVLAIASARLLLQRGNNR